MTNRENSTKNVLSEVGHLVPLSKSKRLATLAKQVSKTERSEKSGVLIDGYASTELTHESLNLLKNAELMIDLKIAEIKKRYPSGKQNKMFKVRYGNSESLKHKCLKEVFELLCIEKPSKFDLIAELNCFGHKAS